MNTTATIKAAAETAERTQFLTDVLIGAVEHCGYGWFDVDEWEPGDLDAPDGQAYALVTEAVGSSQVVQHRLDLATVAKGIEVIKAARLADFPTHRAEPDRVLANADTGERLYLAQRHRDTILEAEREHDASEIDVVLALAIVECGVFGRVEYA